MRRRHGLALLFLLLPILFALQGCGDGENTNTSVNVNVNVNGNGNGNANTNIGIGVNASPTPTDGQLSIDEIMDRMGVGNIAFNVPEAVKLEEAQTVELTLSPKQSGEQLKEQLRGAGRAGRLESYTIKLSKEMQAVLTGDGFQITPITTPDTQPVKEKEPTRWSWDVRPTRVGRVTLHFVVNAIIDYRNGREPYTIKTFDKFYIVEVSSPSPSPAATSPVRPGGIWSWLLPAMLVPAGGAAAWLWLRARRRRRGAFQLFQRGTDDPKIFLSYRREDTAGHAGRLRDALAERFGPARVFMDLESIRAGDDFVEVVKKGVDSSGVVIILIGKHWLSATDGKGARRLDDPRDFVRMEVEAALGRGVRVIPVLVQGAEMPAEDALPVPLAKLARRNAVEVSDARWAFDVERLADAIAETLPG